MENIFKINQIVQMKSGFSVKPSDENYAGSGYASPTHPDFKDLKFKIVGFEHNYYWNQTIYDLIALEYDGEYNVEWENVVEFALECIKTSAYVT